MKCLFCSTTDDSQPYCQWCRTYNPRYQHRITSMTPILPAQSWARLGMWKEVGALGLQTEADR